MSREVARLVLALWREDRWPLSIEQMAALRRFVAEGRMTREVAELLRVDPVVAMDPTYVSGLARALLSRAEKDAPRRKRRWWG